MAYLTKLPLQKTITVRESRDTIVLHIQIKDTDGNPIDYTGADVTGDIKEKKGRAEPSKGTLTFDNTLATGIIKAYVDSTLANTLIDAYESGRVLYTDVEIAFGGWDRSLAEAELTIASVVTE